MNNKTKNGYDFIISSQINVNILLELNSQKEIRSAFQLRRNINSTFSVVHQRLKLLQKSGLLNMKKEGRCLKINLTEEGKLVATKLHELKLLLISDTPKTIHL